eukprot:8804616-Lingulodinium_polyedra.AAC.1
MGRAALCSPSSTTSTRTAATLGYSASNPKDGATPWRLLHYFLELVPVERVFINPTGAVSISVAGSRQ